MSACERIAETHAFADGELTGAAADAMRDHLATCAICQAELADALQLDALVGDRVAAAVPLAWYRRRKLQLAGLALAAAAGVMIYVALPKRAPVEQLALAPHRMTEARLAWSGAAGYRSYDVPRAGEPPHEMIDLMAIAKLDRQGDAHGVGVLELLNGERRQAETYLARAAESSDVLADRAALALASGRPAQALALCDAALARDPAHGPAAWNRGLALRDLGLPRASAIAFRAVAARAEVGWAVEAAARAAALDAETDALEHRFERINQASVALAAGQVTLAPDDARAMPGFARGVLYDAIRSAASADQLAALRPLADAIDAADHGTAMADAIARAGKALHPELAKQYGAMIRALAVEQGIVPAPGPAVPTGEARTRWLAALRAAHADDLLIGALMKLSADRRVVDAGDVAELARLTAASPDPWMQLLGLQQQAEAALQRDDLTGAEATLLGAKQRCAAPGAPAFRCILIGHALGQLYVHWQRLPEAHAALTATWQLARSSGDWITQESLLSSLATLASISDDAEASGRSLVRAYMAEYVQRFPADLPDGRCDRAALGRLFEALLLIDQLQFAEARRALAGPACATPLEPERAAGQLYVRARLAVHDGSEAEVAAVRADIAALRRDPAIRLSEQVELDHSEGRLVVARDRAAGEALLRRSIATARGLPSTAVQAHKLAAWSYSTLVDAAARAGDGAGALAVLAEEQGLEVPARCVLGVAIEDERRIVVARDAAAAIMLHTDAAQHGTAVDAARFVPADVAAALASCASVAVIARPPLHGLSRLLPDSIAWSYLAQRPRPIGASPARSLVIADVEPPPALELPRLATWAGEGERLTGAAATPSKVLAAMASVGEVVIHAHGILDLAQPDAAFLALSPEPDGRFALTTADVRKAHLLSSPLVILAACRSSRAAPVIHETWSLPTAFVYAGARGVIASTAPIPDAEAATFFDGVRARIRAGAAISIALRDERAARLARGGADWVRDIIVFE